MFGAGAVILALSLAGAGPAVSGESFVELGVDTPDIATMTQVPEELGRTATGSWVQLLNDRLAVAGFHPNEGNEFGYRTRHAVFAFQKHHGLETTGVFTAEMWPLLDVEPELVWRREANRVEVDLAKQVLYVIRENEVELVLPVSTGNGASFTNYAGNQVAARTPEGRFAFQRVINGVRESYLGSMYNPYYFHGGYAIHGSPSVPNYPASHGCVRVTNWDMNLLKEHLQIGEPVYVYGFRTEMPPRETATNPAPQFT